MRERSIAPSSRHRSKPTEAGLKVIGTQGLAEFAQKWWLNKIEPLRTRRSRCGSWKVLKAATVRAMPDPRRGSLHKPCMSLGPTDRGSYFNSASFCSYIDAKRSKTSGAPDNSAMSMWQDGGGRVPSSTSICAMSSELGMHTIQDNRGDEYL